MQHAESVRKSHLLVPPCFFGGKFQRFELFQQQRSGIRVVHDPFPQMKRHNNNPHEKKGKEMEGEDTQQIEMKTTTKHKQKKTNKWSTKCESPDAQLNT